MLSVITKWLGEFSRRLFSRTVIRSTDSGLFDPFVPIGSIKRLDPEYRADYPLSQDKENFESDAQPKQQFYLLRTLLIMIAVFVSFRLIALQITQGQENYQLAEGNRLKNRLISAPRGLIYDRNGVALVANEPSFAVVFNGLDFPKDANEKQHLVELLSRTLGLDRGALNEKLAEAAREQSVVIAEGLSREAALSLEIKLFASRGVELVKTPVRRYGEVIGLGSLLGYVGKVSVEDLKERPDLLPTDFVGKSGVEKTYDGYLQGTPGQETLEVDSFGRTIRSVGSKPPRVGRSLILSLDGNLQATTASALTLSINKSQAKSGAAVALDPRTGEVLAMVSLPTFSNNLFSSQTSTQERQAVLSDPSSPLINRAIAGQYPSGSTIKPVVATAALAERVITATTKLDTSEGKIVIGQWTFPDWKTHGLADVRQAIAESNNLFFYALGGGYKQIAGLGAERLGNFLKKFGFGERTGIDLPGEQAGLVPNPEWKHRVKEESWYIGDTYNLAIGQGDLLVTPLQLVNATSVIAAGGRYLQPHLVRTVLEPNGAVAQELAKVVRNSQVAEASTLQVVREGMRRAVQTGSARSFAAFPVEVAAKTGTAQFDKAKEKTHSWFTAFAPFHNPEIAVAVIVEGGGEGFAIAAPVAKNMLERYFNLPLTPINPAEHQ